MVREYVSGAVVERVAFPVGNAAKIRKPRRKGSTTPRKQEENDRRAARTLARLINCNFSAGDILVTLSYGPERLEKLKDAAGAVEDGDALREAAVHERNLFLRRLTRGLAQKGIDLKYIAVTADTGFGTDAPARLHHHIILPKAAFDLVFRHWSRTEVDYRPLKDQKDYTPVAEYLTRQVKRRPDQKKYTCSRNLAKPVVREKIVYAMPELKAPRGAVVTHRDEYDRGAPFQYIRYIKPKRQLTINN